LLNQGPFVGRERELATLLAQLATVRGGSGGVALVAGEPGIGKTRLLGELAAEASTAGTLVVVGHAYDGEGGLPYGPFVEALRSYVRTADPDVVRRHLGGSGVALTPLLPELADCFSELLPGRVESPELDRTRLFNAVTELLFAAAGAARGGLLLVLEDLHWADAASLALLQHLARRLGEAPLLLTLTYRTVDQPPARPLQAALADLTRQQPLARVRLQPLQRTDVARLLAELVGAPAAPPVAERVYGETEGNPFFVTELVRELAAAGVDLSLPDAAAVGWSVPDGVRQVIGSRLARLSAPANALLQAAAVLSAGFRFELLVALDGGTAAALLAPLEEVLAAGLLQERAGGFDFAHALTRQTIGEQLSLPRRQHLHLQAAEAIERVYAGNLDPHVAALAEHYRLAGAMADAEKAVDYLLRAADAARTVFAYAEAVTRWQAALALLEQRGGEPARRASVLETLGTHLQIMGYDRYADGIDAFAHSLQLFESLADTRSAARLHMRLGSLLASNHGATMDLERGLAHIRTAERLLAGEPERGTHALLYMSLASCAIFALHTDEGLAAAHRARQIAERLRREDYIGAAMKQAASLHVAAGRPSEGIALLDRAWTIADGLNLPYDAFNAAIWRADMLMLLDDPAAARELCEREVSQPRHAQSHTRRQSLMHAIASSHARTGNLVEVERLRPELGSVTLDQFVRSLTSALVAFYTGAWQEAEIAWTAAARRNARTGSRVGQVDFTLWLARLYHVRGQLSQASALLQQNLAIVLSGPHLPLELASRAGLALIAAEQGDATAARAHVERCREVLAQGEDWRGLAGRIADAEGALAAALGDSATAAARFEEACAIYRRYQLPWEEADSLRLLGRALLAAGQRPQALEKLNDALAVYAHVGAADHWRERVLADVALAEQVRPHQSSGTRYPVGLTAREVEVLRLVAAGKTNPEIAAALVVSRATVAFHVRSILNKTGVTNRTEAATYAHHHQLTRPSA
jgi:DNA-binding CsgD family transcriptional regulator/tetratricopeptide (TPR) repeat protein